MHENRNYFSQSVIYNNPQDCSVQRTQCVCVLWSSVITLLVIRVAETGKGVQSPLHVYKGSLHAGRIMYNTNQHPFLCQTVNTSVFDALLPAKVVLWY